MDFAAARQIMVDSQIRPNDVTDLGVIAAFLTTPREMFTPKARQSVAYGELEIETSEGRALWTPRDTAKLIAAAQPSTGELALVIGAGAGYEAAILARLVDTVIAMDEDTVVVEAMGERFAALEIDGAVSVEGKLADGMQDQGPFDLIFVCGMVEHVPKAWTDQLVDGGRLAVVVQIDRDLGRARLYRKAGDTISHLDIFDTRPPKFEAFNQPKAFQF